MIVLLQMFASWYCIGIFDIFSVVIDPNVEWCFWFTNVLNGADTILVRKYQSCFHSWLDRRFQRFCWFNFQCFCWNKLLTAKATFWIAWDTFSCLIIIFSFYEFFIVMDGVCANDLFQASVFSKDYNGKSAKGFLQLGFVCKMCQCFVRIFFRFGKAPPYEWCYW